MLIFRPPTTSSSVKPKSTEPRLASSSVRRTVTLVLVHVRNGSMLSPSWPASSGGPCFDTSRASGSGDARTHPPPAATKRSAGRTTQRTPFKKPTTTAARIPEPETLKRASSDRGQAGFQFLDLRVRECLPKFCESREDVDSLIRLRPGVVGSDSKNRSDDQRRRRPRCVPRPHPAPAAPALKRAGVRRRLRDIKGRGGRQLPPPASRSALQCPTPPPPPVRGRRFIRAQNENALPLGLEAAATSPKPRPSARVSLGGPALFTRNFTRLDAQFRTRSRSTSGPSVDASRLFVVVRHVISGGKR